MTKPKFLYGAAVQGIQSFIFQTDKLKDIIGGSELVEHVCTTFFKSHVCKFDETKLIIGTAGNIKYVFENQSDCEHTVLHFPMEVMNLAPGISISQAVVRIEGELKVQHINELEHKLKIQRNKHAIPIDIGCLITERARNTGNPAVFIEDGESIDAGTQSKRRAQKELNGLAKKMGENDAFAYDFEKMVKSSDRSWMAVIHADGNGLGKVLQQLGNKLQDKSEAELISTFKEFSENLEKSTVEAANTVFKSVFYESDYKFYPFRPIILGGDDLTIIIRSEYALEYTRKFLEAFEVETSKNLKGIFQKFQIDMNCLTACAGIAYVKSSFPFHYGYDLAEQLCGDAKKQAKEINKENVPACLMFHKVQSSFVGSFDEIVKQELTCYDNLSFVAGPYYLNQPERLSIKTLEENSALLLEEGAPASQLRKWLTERYANVNSAKSLMERTVQVLDMDNQRRRYIQSLNLNPDRYGDNKEACPYYDYISMASLLKN